MDDERFAPRRSLGVMVSSTFADLKQHRAALMKAIEAQGFYPEAMEHDAALPDGTVVDSSLQKVRDAAAYIGVISHKYGQVPDSADSNLGGFSLTELEFREARRLGRPMLIFIMGDDHDVKPNAVERDPDKIRKLEAFRDEVKLAAEASRLHRVYATFNSLGEFKVAAERSVAELRRFLDGQMKAAPSGQTDGTDDIPRPPALYAEPRYIGSVPARSGSRRPSGGQPPIRGTGPRAIGGGRTVGSPGRSRTGCSARPNRLPVGVGRR